ncbi:MAG: DUF732 domain-containing protein [Corynebacterium sp.]|jgi:hypothetical protein|nr:DUF732 domain-containing protein [Corynebacterium sp.]
MKISDIDDHTAIGPAADETVIVPPLTEEAPKLAWSDDLGDDDDPDDEDDDDNLDEEEEDHLAVSSPWGPVWLGAVAILGCALAMVVSVVIVWRTVHDVSDASQPVSGNSMPLMEAAPALPPQGSAEGSPESNTAGPVTETSLPSVLVNDKRFLAQINEAGIQVLDTTTVLASAGRLCGYLTDGNTPHQAAQVVMQEYPTFTSPQAAIFTIAAMKAYCPEYLGQVGEPG